ncbi:MAG: SDR family NAD(P)-dependent oxidoreductase [Bradymonadaceae bacterium]
MSDLDDRWALVTGGSSGLGVDIARKLADRGASMILVARREERLEEVAAELEDDHGVDADWISMDLARRGAAKDLYDAVEQKGYTVDVLVNNAGFGIYEEFLETEWSDQESMLDLDVRTPLHLTRLYGEEMVERGWGRILQVASIGAYEPTPLYATYSASKALLRNFSEAFDFELDGTGVSCTTVCPGVTRTEFFDSAGQDEVTLYQKLTMMKSENVASIAVRAMMQRRRLVVPGILNSLTMWSTRFMPRRLLTYVAYLTMRQG